MKTWIKSFVQHGLTALGAVLLAAGIVDQEQVTEFIDCNTSIISGGLVYLIGQIWGITTTKE